MRHGRKLNAVLFKLEPSCGTNSTSKTKLLRKISPISSIDIRIEVTWAYSVTCETDVLKLFCISSGWTSFHWARCWNRWRPCITIKRSCNQRFVSTASAVSVEQNSLANFSRSVFLPNIGRQFPVRCTLPNTDLPLTLPWILVNSKHAWFSGNESLLHCSASVMNVFHPSDVRFEDGFLPTFLLQIKHFSVPSVELASVYF